MNKKKTTILIKSFSLIFILSLSLSLAPTHRAQAFWGVGDITFDPKAWVETSATSISSGTTAGATTAGAATGVASFSWSAVGSNLLDYAAYAAAQNLLTQLTNNTVKWIQGGMHGSPSFDVDTQQTLDEITDATAGNLILKIRGIQTCNFTASYKDDLTNAVYLEPKKRDYKFDDAAKCPFKENYEFKASDFYAGLNKFTWDAFGSALEDSGNPYGLETLTAKEMADNEAAAKAKKEKELSWSNGYANIYDPKSCTYPSGVFLEEGSMRALSQEEQQQLAESGAGTAVGGEVAMTQAEANAYNAQLLEDPTFVRNLQSQNCKTTTPGGIIKDMLPKALQSDADRIGFADNMNKIISAFIDMQMQRTVRNIFGTDSSAAVSSATSGGGGSPLSTDLASCPVKVFTARAIPSKTSATLEGRVTCASTAVNANVSVWFRWKPGSMSKLDDTTATKWFPSSGLNKGLPYESDLIGQTFSATIPGLTPATIYNFNANGDTSQNDPANVLNGVVCSFTTQASTDTAQPTPVVCATQ